MSTKTQETLRYRGIADLNSAIVTWSRTLPHNLEKIVGVPRSGVIAGSLLALHMHLPYQDLPAFLAGLSLRSGERGPRGSRGGLTLIVDDTSNSGNEMRRVRDQIVQSGYSLDSMRFAAIYVTPEGSKHVDSFAEVLPNPRAFEWNILNHSRILENSCMDIDGVLCTDPTGKQNDDGARYRKFLSDTELRYLPGAKVGTLVTSRLEKYRSQTVDWLRKNDVSYRNLVMLDLETAAERRRLRAHAPHKARAYLDSGANLFIESSAAEGKLIFDLTKRPVFITDTREFIGEGSDASYRPPGVSGVIEALRVRRALSRRARI